MHFLFLGSWCILLNIILFRSIQFPELFMILFFLTAEAILMVNKTLVPLLLDTHANSYGFKWLWAH